MKRKFFIYCVDVSGEESEYELRFEVNGELKDKIVEYCFDDVLNDIGDFYYGNLEKYKYDSRFDDLKVEIIYKR